MKAHDATRAPPLGRLLPPDEVCALLVGLSEAGDFASAATLLLERFAAAAGAPRAVLLVSDQAALHLELAQHVGFERPPGPVSIPIDRRNHPLVATASGLDVVSGDRVPEPGLPFERWVAVPLAQPRARGAPALRGDEAVRLDERFGACVIRASRRRRDVLARRAPFGVVVLEGRPDDAVIDALADAAFAAGPALARAYAFDDLGRSARRLGEQQEMLSSIIGALPDPIMITDGSNNIVLQNARAQTLLTPQDADSEGRRRAVEINNLLFSSFLSKTILSGGSKATARELNLVDPDEGTDLLFEVLAHPLPASAAGEGGYASVLRDVTDLKRASSELERQFQRLRVTEQEATRERDRLNLMLSNVGDPILVTDDQSKIILMNPQAVQLFEMHRDSDDPQQVQRIRGNDTKFTTLIADFALSALSFRRERVTLTQPETGADLPMEVVAGKVVNERGEPIAIVSVLHDLTKQVENERLYHELKKLNAELEDRIRLATADLEAQNLRLQWQSTELEKAYRLKSEFLANMSHELRTPINALIGYTALMLDRIYGELTPKQVEGLTRIQSSSQHLLVLINDVLDLAKIEAGKMPVYLEPVALRPVILEVAAQVEPLVRKKSLDFRHDLDPEIPVLLTDRTKLKQIVLNLLSNAVKFTHRGSVWVRARRVGAQVELVVGDTGLGIRREHLDVIFEEFRQVDQSRTREYGGTGLGLSITRKLISLLGGRIAVESEYGKGTTFTVTLPLRSEPLTIEEQVARAAIGARRPS